MSDTRVRRRGGPITHAVQWRNGQDGKTWCGLAFALSHNNDRTVEDDVDCMGCLVRTAHQTFESHFDAVMRMSNKE